MYSFDICMLVVQLLKRNASSRLGAGAGDATEVQVRINSINGYFHQCCQNNRGILLQNIEGLIDLSVAWLLKHNFANPETVICTY